MPIEAPPASSPTPRNARKVSVPEPSFSDAPAAGHDAEVMDVNPTSRADLEAKGAAPRREYVPDPFGGKSGPAHLAGEDLARSGGGPDQRIDDRQGKLAEKYRNDPAIKQLMQDEAKKVFGVLPEGDAAPVKAISEQVLRKSEEGEAPAEGEKPERNADDVAEIAKLSREKRELKDRIKAADGARTDAKRLEMYKEIAKEYPLAAVKALLDVDAESLYEDDVKGKSKSVGDKFLQLDPAKKLAEEDAVGTKDRELQEERQKRVDAEARLAQRNASDTVVKIAREDGKRWELSLRDPDIGQTVVKEVLRLYTEADAKAGGPGKGWRPKDGAEAAEFTRSVLDDLEKHYEGLGKRFARGTTEAAPVKKGPPKPPAGQRSPTAPARGDYARPAKRESVEDRQDKLVAKYSGMSFTND